MVSKIFLIAAAIAYVEARFGQEQVPIAAISAVQGGNPGQAATIAGAAISDLLGAANSCAKLATADKIFSDLGGGADALAAAIGMVTAEKNTNPFAGGNAQNVCGDASLPATQELRGITPLIDPAVDTDGGVAALSASSAQTPLDATGKSVFDLLDEAGFGNLVVSQAAAGGAAAGGAAAGGNAGNANAGNANAGNAGNANAGNANAGNANAGNANAGNANAGNAAAGNAAAGNATACNADAGNAQQGQGKNNNAGNANAGNNNNANAGNANAGNNNANAGNNNANAGNNNANAGGAAAGGAAAGGAADFGKCTPTIFRAGGLNGRPATEFTFQIQDPLARGGQGEALNPNIITNALCNQLTNVCDANQAAIDKCLDAKAQVQAAGTRDDSTVTLFNNAILGGAARKRSMRRGIRSD
ncbi:hypothetical protein DM02DRAFT_585764 [Periconia macrospinosa]|uniref:Circumsporozoite protein n=1 Tax=Periconia macrospinosa TaxID=97972 RepID=A0A2V1E5X6_9PLEO|nr:hypothetical protein DM02DRAFT_585764 [Periconia macrospinosa]